MKKYILLLVLLFLAMVSTNAQDTLTKKEYRKQQKNFLLSDKSWTLEVPLWIPGFAGEFVYGDVTLEGEDGVDPENPIEPPPGGSIGKILSRLFTQNWYLKYFYLTKISYENKDFLVQMDGAGGEIGNSVKFNYNNKEIVQSNFRTLNFRFLVGYRFIDVHARNKKFRYELYGYLGARLHFQRIYSDLNRVINKLDINPVWAEPVFGLQNQFSWKKWFLVVQGDYGGFFINSRYSLQLTTQVFYRTGRFVSFKLGWNHLRLNHKGVFLTEDYLVSATLSGPSAGIVFLF